MNEIVLTVLPDELAVCRLEPTSAVPAWLFELSFFSLTRTAEEISIVLPAVRALPGWRSEAGWRALKVSGPLDFSLTGILAGLSGALAADGISLFALSTYDTDYLLVRSADLEASVHSLRRRGYMIL
ncbi:MAG: ACT domain-containing protein [Chloroflexi bacterium]|jgi:hypothetical protein|nr:ACT domain-containing protein [Anaerolineaceae bacterium]NMB89514.1 ACT domain-containing protein [Chloroflexota bacterium]